MASQTRGITPDAYRSLIDTALAQGWSLSHTGGGHIRLDPPGGGRPIFCGKTANGGRRAEANLRATLRRHGVTC